MDSFRLVFTKRKKKKTNSTITVDSGRMQETFVDDLAQQQQYNNEGGKGEDTWNLNESNRRQKEGEEVPDTSLSIFPATQKMKSSPCVDGKSASSDDQLYMWAKGKNWSKLRNSFESDSNIITEEVKRESISYRDEYARSVLHYVCIRGASEDIVMDFLELGGRELVFVKDHLGRTALHDACYHGASANINVVQSLLSYGRMELLMTKNDKGCTALHEAVRYGTSANANLVEYLLSQGGVDLVMAKDDSSRKKTALHYACKYGASIDVVKCLVSYGGKKLVVLKDRTGQTALHYTYICGGSKDVIKFLLNTLYKDEFGEGACDALANALVEHDGVNVVDETDYSNPIDYFLSKEYTQYDTLARFQSIWCELDPLAASATTESFANTLQRIEGQKYAEDRDKILKGTFVQAALNQATVQVLSLFVLFADITSQLALNFALSFLVMKDEMLPDIASVIIIMFLGWILIRELTQLYFAKTIHSYVFQQSNWIDLAQVILVMFLLVKNPTSGVDGKVLIAAIGVSWFRLVVVSSNLAYSVAVFVRALVTILLALLPFLYVTCIVIIAFAHMFYVAGPLNGENIAYCVDEKDFDKKWMCDLQDSYWMSFSMFLTGNIPFLDQPAGTHSVLAGIFGFIMGILLLNIIIAIISSIFSEIRQNSEKAFWANRLHFVNEINNMRNVFIPRYLNCWCERRRKVILPSRRSLVDIDLRGYNHWRVHSSHAPFIEWFVDEKDTDFSASRLGRLYSFLRTAEWKEIIPPSIAFRRVIMLKRQNEELNFCETLISMNASIIFLMLFVVMAPVVLVLGFVTCGYFWPRELKRELFFVKVKKIEDGESEILKLKAELEQARQSHTSEIEQLKTHLEKVHVAEVDRLEKRLDEVLGLLHVIAHPNNTVDENSPIATRMEAQSYDA